MTAVSSLLDDVMQECNFRKKGVYALATSQNEQQLFRIANRSVAVLMGHPWSGLRKTHTITLTGDTEYPLPSDYHAIIPDTGRANSRLVPVDTNTNASVWHWLQSRGGIGGVQYRTRFYGTTIEVFSPTAGDVITFEYQSKHPIQATGGGALKAKFTDDSDEWLLDDDLLMMECIWRFKKAKGLEDWRDDRADAGRYFRDLVSRDTPAKTLNTVQPQDPHFGEPHTNLWKD